MTEYTSVGGMTHREKVKHFIAEMKKKGVSAYTAAPPFWRMMWLLGIKVPPPYYTSAGAIAIMTGTFFGAGMAVVALVSRLPVAATIAIFILGGGFFGVVFASMFRSRMDKISMPSDWSTYPGHPAMPEWPTHPDGGPAPATRAEDPSRNIVSVLAGIFVVLFALVRLAIYAVTHGWIGGPSSVPDFTPRSGRAPPRYQSASVPPTVTEQMPSLTQGTRPLSASQVRYCLSQGIRIEAANKAVNTASTAEASRFRALVDDYNPRCGNYHHTPGIFDSVKEEVEAQRATLALQGVALIRPPDPEEKPPVAQGALLPEPQVRYCLAQGIRIQGAAKTVNTAVAAEASRFLALEDDYNPRCGNYRLAAGVANSIKEQVEARRAALEREGAALIRPPARF